MVRVVLSETFSPGVYVILSGRVIHVSDFGITWCKVVVLVTVINVSYPELFS